jgi:hypothetical protein
MLPTSFVPGAAPAMPAQIGPSSQANDIATQANMVAHESNGMVYYYDPASLPGGSQSAPMPQYATIPAGGVLGMGGMITPPAQYYYPPGNGMYYTHQ